ncbi:MAG: cupin domain-containing protein [Thermodesulfobacteriota bacterium]
MAREIYDEFNEQGYVGPFRVLSTQECQQVLQVCREACKRCPTDWDKGYAASSRAFYEIATHPAIIEVVSALLGEDIILWGARMLSRSPNSVHPWHSDIESSDPLGKTVSVWIGIEHTNRDSSLLIIPYSHRFGVTVQEIKHQFGKSSSDETPNDDIVRWARERDKRSDIVRSEMTDGEALFFNGHLWHGSHNLLSETRWSLLLQYATPDTVIRIPDPNNSPDWPFHQLNHPRPPCIMVKGSAKADVNRIVSAPAVVSAQSSPQLTSRVYPLRIPLPPDDEMGWKPYPIFQGTTADMRSLSCHVSVLNQGQCPHPPHTHEDEELLLLLAGEVDLILPHVQTPNGDQRRRMKAGQFVYYPAQFAHTLQTVSEHPANYLMFKWDTDSTETDSPLAFGHFNLFDPTEDSEFEDGFYPHLLFEGPTACLQKLHCHTSTLTPGAGYDPHIDAYDVGIVVLEGEVETLGERVGPHSVIFYPAGEPHGMRNPGEGIAKYVVFEFHGSQTAQSYALPNLFTSLLTKITDLRSWKRMLKRLLPRRLRRLLKSQLKRFT